MNSDFGDKRRNSRARKIASMVENSEGGSVSSILFDRADLKGALRFMNNSAVSPENILEGFIKENIENIQTSHVLLVEDSSELNFSWRKTKLEGLGPVGNGLDQGFFLHPGLLVDPKKETILGLGSAYFWHREYEEEPHKISKKKQQYKKKKINEKESYRWLKIPGNVRKFLPDAIRMTVVADREGDIFDLFHERNSGKLGENIELLIRACRDRKLDTEKTTFFSAINDWKVKGKYDLKVEPGKKRTARVAKMEIRFNKMTMSVPKTHSKINYAPIEDLYVVDVRKIIHQKMKLQFIGLF